MSIADDIVEGGICQECCMPFEDAGEGYPRTCSMCKHEYEDPDTEQEQLENLQKRSRK